MNDNKEAVQHILYEAPNSIDQLLSKELQQLSLKDRIDIEEEIHGVSTIALNETPYSLQISLQEMSKALSEIPDDRKASYNRSQILPNTYVNGSDFRLRFLRFELFDAKKAATRMVKFLDFASHLFGQVVLKRPMKITDLTKEDKKWMQNFQTLPYRDQSGRPIRAWVGDFAGSQINIVSIWRVVLYVTYSMSDDIETQQKGFVSLIWIASNQLTLPLDWKHFEYGKIMLEACPIRQCSIHWCMPELPLFHPIHVSRCAMALGMGKKKSRVKFHIGNKVELMYKLKSYGIPVEWIPVTETGSIKTISLKQWIKGRRHLEEAREKGYPGALSITLCPGSSDVIFRGGTSLKYHPGNAMFESMLEAKLWEHLSGSQKEKVAITKSIITTIQQNGRFLIWDNHHGWWEGLTDESEIHNKIAKKIRCLSNKLNVQQQTSRSSTIEFQNQDNSKRRKVISPDHSDCSSYVESCCLP